MVYRVLQNLLILDGERLSYRTLDVEQIGSVYETIMGFDLEVAEGRCIAIRPTKPHGAPTTINLEKFLAVKPAERAKWIKEKTDQSLTGLAAAALKEAGTIEGIVAALEKKVAHAATPNIVPAGAMILQPSDERRRSGSHYTPRTLTEPIVRTTLRPIQERLGANPTPEQILDLKICDPAMGSGAFLVAVCRFLAELLVKAWHSHDRKQSIPPDEDEILHAARIVAQRCLYGVDKNPLAVDLAKLSLWLATLAKDHTFTFLDHALKCGDSLVGLSKAQILGFHWKPEKQQDFTRAAIEGQLNRAMEQRKQIREAPDGTSDVLLREKLQAADGFLDQARRYGDLVISAFFAAENDRKRKDLLESLAADLAAQRSDFTVERHNRLERAVNGLRSGIHAVIPFHWAVEFPEVFDRVNPGFDAFVGNPPFLAKNSISNTLPPNFGSYLLDSFDKSNGKSDLVAYFFRRAFDLLRLKGTLGLIATNTISQGDTRATGLTFICSNGGVIYRARKRFLWPGIASVSVSIVHVIKGPFHGTPELNGRHAKRVSAFLFHDGPDSDPTRLAENLSIGFQGSNISGQGFLFDDSDPKANPISLMMQLIQRRPENQSRIRPFIGGTEVNSRPDLGTDRFVIEFGRRSLEECRREWPDLVTILEEKVKPDRESRPRNEQSLALARRWWQWHTDRPTLQEASKGLERVIVASAVSSHMCFAFQPTSRVFAHTLNVFALAKFSEFACLQSRPHEVWTLFLASSLEERLRYTITDCFETFPLPPDWRTDAHLDKVGSDYYHIRSLAMTKTDRGLTDIYNAFHDPDERSADILKLRELHAVMDRAVLDAYGWTDLKPTCEFLLDYEEDEEDVDESGGGRRRKKPWRYRWPDEFRDEVLARLLELNRQRAEMERLGGVAAEKAKKPRKTGKKTPGSGQMGMF